MELELIGKISLNFYEIMIAFPTSSPFAPPPLQKPDTPLPNPCFLQTQLLLPHYSLVHRSHLRWKPCRCKDDDAIVGVSAVIEEDGDKEREK